MLCRFRFQYFKPFFGLQVYLGGRIQDDAEKHQAWIVIAAGVAVMGQLDKSEPKSYANMIGCE